MPSSEATPSATSDVDFDAIVVGGGMGGIYAVYRLQKDGLTVQAFEGGADVGGVWFHNKYPGARVDVEGAYYSFYFDQNVYDEWEWKERYPAQPEIQAYLSFVADKHDIKARFQFETWVNGAQWDPEHNRYTVTTDKGDSFTCRYLVMTTGQLSKARKPQFEGLDDFQGEWVQTAHWPDRPVDTIGKRIAVIGTGSSGVQAIPLLAEDASHLYVFQRTANYGVPANNGPFDKETYDLVAKDLEGAWGKLLAHPAGATVPMGTRPGTEMTAEEQQAQLDKHWEFGGHAMNAVFKDQGTTQSTNDIVSNYVRGKVREIVKDPKVADDLVPTEYPIGSRRLGVQTRYYETYNRDNVTLINVKKDPIVKITPTGIQTENGHFEVDLIVFALGFEAFTGALDSANIRNENGEQPSDKWRRGPKTFLGLMTNGFPNLFIITGPGSPSVLANMVLSNVQHLDFAADAIAYMESRGYTRIEPTVEAQDEWSDHVAEVASKLIRKNVDNYMVHVNHDDGTRVFKPYAGGIPSFVAACEDVVKNDYKGFEFA